MRKYLWLAWLLLVGSALFLVGCGSSQTPPAGSSAGSISLTGAGATFPYPLYSKWFAEYSQVNPEVSINYQSIGSGGGIQQLKAGTVDFGASDAPLSDDELKAMPQPVIHLPMTAGAVVVAYNLAELKQPLRLSGPVLADIFLGKITSWDDPKITGLNPNLRLPTRPIAVVHRSDGSGTSYIFTNYLKAVSNEWSDKVGAGKSVNWPVGIGGKGNEGVTGVVKQTPSAIAYLELAYAQQNKIPYAQMQNQAGRFIEPTVASTAAAAAGAAAQMKEDVRISIVNSPGRDAYPIAGFTYILIYREQADRTEGQALVNFLDWAVHAGQQYAQPLAYAPLPAAVVQLNEAALKSVTVNGQPMQAGK